MTVWILHEVNKDPRIDEEVQYFWGVFSTPEKLMKTILLDEMYADERFLYWAATEWQLDGRFSENLYCFDKEGQHFDFVEGACCADCTEQDKVFFEQKQSENVDGEVCPFCGEECISYLMNL